MSDPATKVPTRIRAAYLVNREWLEKVRSEVRKSVEHANYPLMELRLKTCADWVQMDRSGPEQRDHLRVLNLCREKVNALYKLRMEGIPQRIPHAIDDAEAALDNAQATLAAWALREHHARIQAAMRDALTQELSR